MKERGDLADKGIVLISAVVYKMFLHNSLNMCMTACIGILWRFRQLKEDEGAGKGP